MEWLKKSFRKPKTLFSYQFENPPRISLPETELRFDVKISYRYDCLIVIASDIYVFDRKSKLLINSFKFANVVLSTLDDEHDELYVMIPDRTNYKVEKYSLGQFIRSKEKEKAQPIWSVTACSNPYGAVVFNGLEHRYLIILDNSSDESNLIIVDCEDGSLIENTIFTVPPNGYSLGMISRKEIIVGCSDIIGIYEIDEKSFGATRQALNLIVSASMKDATEFYSIIHDELNRKIILSNADSNSITVMRRDNLETVQTHNCEGSVRGVSGLCLDEYTGELYVCFSNGLLIYK
ncbi:predicted protein [Naegleria gruberi]|uniref:Predicted protein n=1 Tax=Naegleria gruberi TaxID=5762 RepID=D2VI45_NAEGR|nr:uncharacterized protein NAEGRDRAFT_68556 [Naegleria gruberi]EFC43453.1 predicted protein [Naegleria gruberi]|eukprot:XP_002676197.1 predicted protein [Naegleria gruberi strain NEG-M]